MKFTTTLSLSSIYIHGTTPNHYYKKEVKTPNFQTKIDYISTGKGKGKGNKPSNTSIRVPTILMPWGNHMYELKIQSIKYLHTQSFDISQRQSMLYINSARSKQDVNLLMYNVWVLQSTTTFKQS